MSKIVVSEFMDDAAVDFLRRHHPVHFDPTLVDTPAKLKMAVRGACGLIVRNRTRVDKELLGGARELRAIGRLGVGLDNIDAEYCAGRGIKVHTAVGANNVSVAEYVMMATLVLTRGVHDATAAVAAGHWPRLAKIGHEVSGLRMGLIGFGAAGREVARRAAAFDMEVQAFDPFLAADSDAWRHVRRVELPELLSTSDIVSVHVPLTSQTRNMIDRTALRLMKPSAVLINTARGGVVDENALVDALLDKAVRAAALDVFAQEPLSAEQGRKFAGLPNLMLTPHVAGLTVEANSRVAWMIARHVHQTVSGAGSDPPP